MPILDNGVSIDFEKKVYGKQDFLSHKPIDGVDLLIYFSPDSKTIQTVCGIRTAFGCYDISNKIVSISEQTPTSPLHTLQHELGHSLGFSDRSRRNDLC